MLYIVATPIGNLADISRRAIDVLSSVDLIAAEDTRHTAKILQTYNIHTPVVSYHDHNETEATQRLVALITNGTKIALVSDAGTPLIHDPGFRLVQAVKKLNIPIIPIPGPCALITALSASGLPANRFLFLGFPPRSESQRNELFHSIVTEPGTLIFYESGQRLYDTLISLNVTLGANRKAVLMRELTKLHETMIDGTLESIAAVINNDVMQKRGEHVLLVAGAEFNKNSKYFADERVLQVLLEELSVKQAVNLAAKITGSKPNELYRLALLITSQYHN